MAPTATYTATVFFRAKHPTFYYRENVTRGPPRHLFFFFNINFFNPTKQMTWLHPNVFCH